MVQKQKETVLALLKSQISNKSYENNYWFSYKDFLNPTDDFTDFACENLDGKLEYITVIKNLLYADTLIIFSRLPLHKVKEIFNASKDIYPSDIGELPDFDQHNFIIDENGDLVPVSNSYNNEQSIYYCWWD